MSTKLETRTEAQNKVHCSKGELSVVSKNFLSSGHENAEIIDFNQCSIIKHNLIMPSQVLECISTKGLVVIPSIVNKDKFDADVFIDKLGKLINERMPANSAGYKFLFNMCMGHDLYTDYLHRYAQPDYYAGEFVNEQIRNIASACVRGQLFEVAAVIVEEDEEHNPHIFAKICFKKDFLVKTLSRFDKSKAEHALYMSRVKEEYAFSPNGTTSYEKMADFIRAINVFQWGMKEIISDAIIDAVSSVCDEEVKEYFKDSWSDNSITLEDRNVVYAKNVVIPDGKTIMFRDSVSQSFYLGQLEGDYYYFPQEVNLGAVKDEFEKLLNMSTLTKL